MICLDDKSVSIPEKTWNNALKHIHDKKGYVPEMLSDKPIRTYINQATKVLQKAVNYGIADNVIPERMRQHLDNDTFLFSGHKVHSALEQANIKLRNEKGNIKSFDAFKLEVKGIDKAYNQTYLQAEYQFAVSSSQSAANWAKTQADGDRYNLRYKTAGDDNVRDSHRILDGITLPPSDPFWNSYYPPNGWRCRCEAIQVRKSKYETTDPDQAENAGQRATSQIGKDGANKAQIFRFNPGKQERIFPPKHPYYKGAEEVKEVLTPRKELVKEYKNGGKVEVYTEVNREHGDYSQVMNCALGFAKNGSRVVITPRVHVKDKVYKEIYGDLTGTKYQGKCPDFSVDGKYFEHEGHKKGSDPKRAFSNMLKRGVKQSDKIVIEDCGLSDGYMIRSIHGRIKEKIDISEVWILSKKTIRRLY